MDDLYTLKFLSEDVFEILWNKNHPVFLGHFPGRPIVPASMLLRVAEKLFYPEVGLIQFEEFKISEPVLPDELIKVQKDPGAKSDSIIFLNSQGKQKARIVLRSLK